MRKGYKFPWLMVSIAFIGWSLAIGFGVHSCIQNERITSQLTEVLVNPSFRQAEIVNAIDLPNIYPAYASFVYGEESGKYTNETLPIVMLSAGDFSFTITGLTPNTTYYYRAKVITASNEVIIAKNEISFTTLKE